MAASHKALASGWAARLIADLAANDQVATRLTRDSPGGLNWQAAPGAWSVGQCIEHLRITAEAYLPAIAAALKSQPYCPMDEIRPVTVGTGIEIIVSHERRHLLQAERVKDAASFPR